MPPSPKPLHPPPEPKAIKNKTLEVDKIVAEYYRKRLHRNGDVVEYAAQETMRFASLINEAAGRGKTNSEGLLTADDIVAMLAMWHVESEGTPGVPGFDGKSDGYCQVLKKAQPQARRSWKRLGVDVGPSKGISAQVAFGVMVYHQKLASVHGDTDKAIERYNGKGPRAKAYLKKVKRARKNIFGS